MVRLLGRPHIPGRRNTVESGFLLWFSSTGLFKLGFVGGKFSFRVLPNIGPLMLSCCDAWNCSI